MGHKYLQRKGKQNKMLWRDKGEIIIEGKIRRGVDKKGKERILEGINNSKGLLKEV